MKTSWKNIVGGVLASIALFFLGVVTTVFVGVGFNEVIAAEKISGTDTLRVIEDHPGLFGSRQRSFRFEHSKSGDLQNLFTLLSSSSMPLDEAKIVEVIGGARVVYFDDRPVLTFDGSWRSFEPSDINEY